MIFFPPKTSSKNTIQGKKTNQILLPSTLWNHSYLPCALYHKILNVFYAMFPCFAFWTPLSRTSFISIVTKQIAQTLMVITAGYQVCLSWSSKRCVTVAWLSFLYSASTMPRNGIGIILNKSVVSLATYEAVLVLIKEIQDEWVSFPPMEDQWVNWGSKLCVIGEV